VEAVAVDHLPVPEGEDLDRRPLALDREPDDVDGADRPPVCRLALGEMPDREEPVPVAGRLLEALTGSRLPHPLLELALDRRSVPGEKCDDAVDDAAVVLRRDRCDARGKAAVDVVVEARDPGVAPGSRALAGAEPEHSVQDVERLPHLLRVCIRTEVDRAAAVAFPREHHAGVLVLDGDGDVRKRLVVAEPDVERRPMTLDEVLLKVQRLGLRSGHDHLDVGDAVDELCRPRARITPLEVAPDSRAE